MALNPIDTGEAPPAARTGRIRRCSVRHVSIVPGPPSSVEVTCLLGGIDHPLPLGSMDAERKARIERLLESLSTTADDSPQRIAMWLIDDASIWLTVLGSNDLHQRQVAHQQLEKIAGTKLAFTPDADSQVRADQLEAIRAKLPRR